MARLVRKLKVPVVSALIQGGYLARPRWAKNVRLGSVRVRYRLLFSGQDLADRGVGEVYRSLSEAVSFDEMAVQRKRLISFPTMAPAEYLERLLFVCPQCHSLGSLFSRGHRFWCTLCGYAVRVNTLGFLVRDAGPLRFDDPADWNAWQLGVFRDYLLKHSHPWTPKLQEKSVRVLRGYRSRRLQAMAQGRLILLKDRIEVHERSGRVLSSDLSSVQGANVQNKEKLEFYEDGVLYRVDFPNPRASSYMWLKAIEILQKPDSSIHRDAASL